LGKKCSFQKRPDHHFFDFDVKIRNNFENFLHK